MRECREGFEEQDVNNESSEAKGTKIDRRDQGAGNDNYCN